MIKVIDNFLSNDECEDFINFIKEKEKDKDCRKFNDNFDNFNSRSVNEEICNKFYNRFIKIVDLSEFNITGVNNIVTCAKYTEGQEFGLHTDTGLYFNKAKALKTTYTVLIYLNDDYKGGNTVFYTDVITRIVPKKGSLLIFDISLIHAGEKVLSGTKYWIGCEFIGNIY